MATLLERDREKKTKQKKNVGTSAMKVCLRQKVATVIQKTQIAST